MLVALAGHQVRRVGSRAARSSRCHEPPGGRVPTGARTPGTRRGPMPTAGGGRRSSASQRELMGHVAHDRATATRRACRHSHTWVPLPLALVQSGRAECDWSEAPASRFPRQVGVGDMGLFSPTRLRCEPPRHTAASDRIDVPDIGDGLIASEIAALRACSRVTFYGSRSGTGACAGEVVGARASDARIVVECAAALSDAAPGRWPAAPLIARASASSGDPTVEAWLATLTPGVRPVLIFLRNAASSPAGVVRDELWIGALPIGVSTPRLMIAGIGPSGDARMIRRR